MASHSFFDLTSFLLFHNFDLLTIGVAVAMIVILGFLVFQNNPKSLTNQTLFILSIAASLWGIANYLSYRIHYSEFSSLLLLRSVLFFAVWLCYYLYKFIYVFPNEEMGLPRWFKKILWPITVSVSLFVFSPFVFKEIIDFSSAGVPMASIGAGIFLFGITVLSLILASFFLLGRKMYLANKTTRAQYRPVLLGTIITFSLLIAFNFILPAFFNNLQFIPFGGVYILPFVLFTTYAIVRHGLFNLKIVATQTFVTIISLVYFGKVLISPSLNDRIADGVIFVATVFFGVLLVQSVKEEIRAREEIRILAKRLTESNWELARTNERLRVIDQRKSEFVSIVSHQLRTPITAIKGYSSMILEESFGAVPETVKAPIEKIFFSSKRLAEMVDEFLDLSKIEQGRMSYNFTSVDIKEMLKDIEEEFTPSAKKKNLALHFVTEDEGAFIVTADKGKVRQIFTNLIDNAIKYTPEGNVSIILGKNSEQGTVIIRIRDTGIGLSQDDIHHLFGKFARGEGGQKQYTEGSGLGLYVAKKILEAHHGKIWVDSPGIGKGSEFTVELLDEEDPQSL